MKLIYDSEISGHHVEYLKHLLTFLQDNPNYGTDFMFVLNRKLVNRLNNELTQNINIHYIDEILIERISNTRSIIYKTYLEINYIKNLLHLNININEVLFLYLDYLQPILSLFKLYSKRKICISGILFNPYSFRKMYSFKNSTLLQKIKEIRKYLQIRQSITKNKFRRIYILNDKKSVSYLNKVFGSCNFRYLPDPVDIDNTMVDVNSFYAKFKIKPTNFKLLLLGSLNSRKNVLNVLKAVSILKKSVLRNITFLIMGRPHNEEYLKLINTLIDEKNSIFKDTQIILHFEDFSLAEMNTALHTTDLVLMPYISFYGSSNLLGHAAKHKKPVIGSNYGLVNQLINEYKLGSTVDPQNIQEIADLIEFYYLNPHTILQGDHFLNEHQPIQFAFELLSSHDKN